MFELGAVRSLSGEYKVTEYAECCEEFVRRIAMYLIKLRAARSLL